jgi:hypothetical protein
VLRPPPIPLINIPRLINSSMSRSAVSCELFVSVAHFDDVSFPSKPLRRWLMTARCRSLSFAAPNFSQKRAFLKTLSRIVSAASKARSRQARNQSSHRVMSRSPCCVAWRTS